MTIKTSGPISLADINAEFGLGNDLYAYRGVKWYRDDNTRGYFDGATGNNAPVDFFEFYGKRKNIPVTPTGDVSYGNGQWFTFPFYNKVTVTLRGGSGGQAGQYGWNGCVNSPTGSGGGGTGGTSSFGSYGSAAGGGGGGGNQGSGSPGATTTLVFNAETDPNAPKAGVPVLITVGGGGGGGGGGPNAILIQTGTDFWGNPQYSCFPAGNAASGASGSPGSCIIKVE